MVIDKEEINNLFKKYDLGVIDIDINCNFERINIIFNCSSYTSAHSTLSIGMSFDYINMITIEDIEIEIKKTFKKNPIAEKE